MPVTSRGSALHGVVHEVDVPQVAIQECEVCAALWVGENVNEEYDAIRPRRARVEGAPSLRLYPPITCAVEDLAPHLQRHDGRRSIDTG